MQGYNCQRHYLAFARKKSKAVSGETGYSFLSFKAEWFHRRKSFLYGKYRDGIMQKTGEELSEGRLRHGSMFEGRQKITGRKMETIARNIRVTAIATAAALAMAYCLFAETMYFAFPVQAQEVSDSLSFDEAVEAFYSGSEDMTDEQILQAARDIKSDVNALYSVLGEKEAAKVEAALNAYEASKVEYMTDVINSEDDGRKSEQPGGTQGQPSGGTATQPGETQGQPSDGSQGASAGSTEELPADDPAGIVSEWLRQSRYTQLMITEGSVIREMIPRFKVTSCTMEEKILKAGIEEWMTQAYGARDGSGAVNASAYSYTFSLSLARGENGTWTPCEVNGTQINYQWLQDASDREQEAGEKKTPDPASGTGQEGTPAGRQ